MMFALAGISHQSFAFGVDGHLIIARIAENHLTTKTRLDIKRIGDGKSLSALALWPDQIRGAPQWRHSKPWHYINIEDGENFATLRRSNRGDVLSALETAYQQLQDPDLSPDQHRQALAFFVHFAGDIHQPLHVGRFSDRGGNRIEVTWLAQKRERNLHWVWDSGLLKHKPTSVVDYSNSLDKTSDQQLKNWQAGSFVDWAEESKMLRSQVYEFGLQAPSDHVSIDQHYIERNKPLLEKRLLMAGVRIAGCLNRLFDAGYLAARAMNEKTGKNPDKKSCAASENLE